MANLKYLLLTLLSELVGIGALFLPSAGRPLLLVAFLIHLAGSLCFALTLPVTLPPGYLDRKSQGLLFFSFIFFIPLFGILGMILILLYFSKAGKKRVRPEFFSIPRLPFTAVEGVKPVTMGEGGAWSRLRDESISRQVKIEALMAAGVVPGQQGSRLLRMATGDSDDEIRLVAFNIFDRREKNISASISQMLQELKNTDEDSRRGVICGRLAFSYWEFIYNELVRDELKDFCLEQALYYARLTEELSKPSHPIAMLIGRILLIRGDVDGAERAIERALAMGAAPSKGVPFQAEILYRKRDFAALKRLLSSHPSLRYKPGIGAVVSFWGGV
jgi:polysaccharide biosynthesis protein PelE